MSLTSYRAAPPRVPKRPQYRATLITRKYSFQNVFFISSPDGGVFKALDVYGRVE